MDPGHRNRHNVESALMDNNDVDALLADLDQLIHDAPEVPLVGDARIDREGVYDILDRLRAILPEETKQARWIVKERTDLLREARKECAQIVHEGRRRAEEVLSPEVISREADRNAEEIIEEAREEERKLRLQAEDYADDVLETMQRNLDKFIGAARRGRVQIRGEEWSGDQPYREEER
jgi:vacuolar-type H+-ATPase subunit H